MESRYRTAEAERYTARYAPDHGAEMAARIYTAHLFGEDPEIILHASGNVSLKAREADPFGDPVDVLYVSGEGQSLATIEPRGFAPCRLAHLRKLCDRAGLTDEEMLSGLRAEARWPDGPMPSIDALIHAFLPGKYVDHARPDTILAILNQPGSTDVVRDVFGDRALFVPYTATGAALLRRVVDLVRARTGPSARSALIIIDKHGLFTWGETAQESYEQMIAALARAERYIAETRIVGSRPTMTAPDPELYTKLAPITRGILMRGSRRPWILSWRTSPQMRSFCDRIDMTILAQFGCATPDHAAVMKAKPLVFGDLETTDSSALRKVISDHFLDYASTYEDYVRRASMIRRASPEPRDPWPRVLLFEGLGALTAGHSAEEADRIADLYEHTTAIIDVSHSLQGYQPAGELDMFDAEYGPIFRRARAEDPSPPLLDGRIALVTGAASGIGLATAKALLRAGAHVVLTDRNEAALDAAVTPLRALYAKRVSRVACDVSVETEVRRAVGHACLRFGGLDIVVSNAGGAFSGGLHSDAGTDALRASLEVNLLGHQNVARAAAETLLLQGTGGALLFNAAKSAFDQSPEEGPFAVAKAALIALMRQYAVDLGPSGIRANAVNPARVRTSHLSPSVVEARTQVRGVPPDEFYRDGLLGRETTVDDVASAFVYLATAEATTGCVIAVDGGRPAAFPR